MTTEQKKQRLIRLAATKPISAVEWRDRQSKWMELNRTPSIPFVYYQQTLPPNYVRSAVARW